MWVRSNPADMALARGLPSTVNHDLQGVFMNAQPLSDAQSALSVVVQRAGDSDVLAVEERHVGSPGADDLLVEVAAGGVNFIDIYQRTASMRWIIRLLPAWRALARCSAWARTSLTLSRVTGWRGRWCPGADIQLTRLFRPLRWCRFLVVCRWRMPRR